MLKTPLILLGVTLVAVCTAKPQYATDEADLKVINVESIAKEDGAGEAESPLLSRLRRAPTHVHTHNSKGGQFCSTCGGGGGSGGYGGGKKSGGGGGCGGGCGGGGGGGGSFASSSSQSSAGSYGGK